MAVRSVWPRVCLQVCVAVLAAHALACDGGAPPRWNVLLVTLDTTRADHLGCYGDAGAHTPNFDALAEEGVRFEHAWTSAPITAPAHATLLTGRYPVGHGVRDNGLFSLPEAEETLAERLAARGWATSAAVGAFPLAARFGFAQGFDRFDDRVGARFGTSPAGARLFFDERPAGAVNEAALGWLAEHGSEPFFLWLHYYDPHQPLTPPAPWNQLFAANPYAGEIAYADESFGTVVDALRDRGAWERTLVVVTSDHGEGLGEHGEATHSLLLYEGTLRVPLIVRVPGGSAGLVVREPVGTVDVLPTVLELLGMPVPEGLHGRSLAETLRTGPPPTRRGLYAETLSPRLAHRWGELRAWREGDAKYIHGPRPELYDLAADPRELAPLRADASALHAKLEGFLAREAAAPAQPGAIDAETRRRLEALGYAEAGAAGAPEIVDTLRTGGVAPQDRARDVSALSLAKALLFGGEFAAAESVLDRLVRDDPENPRYRELRAGARLERGAFEGALADLEIVRAAARSSDQTAALLLRLAAIEHARGERDRALDRVRESAVLAPSAAAERLRAQLALEAGDAAELRAALERALELEPESAPARILLAVELDRAGEPAAAEAEFARALADQPYDSRAHYNHGVFLLGRERLPEAHEAFARAAALDPGYGAAERAAAAVGRALGRVPPAAPAGEPIATWDGGSATRADLDAWIRRLPPAERQAPPRGAERDAWYAAQLRALALAELLLARAPEGEGPAPAEPERADARGARGERRLVHHWYRRARTPEARANAERELAGLAERYRAGESFASLARAHSESQSRHVGGVLGWLERDQLPVAAGDVVFALPPGTASEPVAVGPGVHVFLVEQVLPPRGAEAPRRAELRVGGPERALRRVRAAREQALRAAVGEDELRAWFARHPMRFATPLQLRLERTWLPTPADADQEMAWLEAWADDDAPDPAALERRASVRGGGSERLPWLGWPELAAARPLASLLVAGLPEGAATPPVRTVLADGSEGLEVLRVLGRREPLARPFDVVRDEVWQAWLASEGPARWPEVAAALLADASYRASLASGAAGWETGAAGS